jgi:hypothetical protein
MLWRGSYETEIRRGFSPPTPLGGQSLAGQPFDPVSNWALVAGCHDAAFREVELWRRLIADSFADLQNFAFGIVRPEWSPRQTQELAALIPPSQHRYTYAWTDPEETWRQETVGDRQDRAFALVRGNGLLMVGPPTEEAWDEFEAAIRLSEN